MVRRHWVPVLKNWTWTELQGGHTRYTCVCLSILGQYLEHSAFFMLCDIYQADDWDECISGRLTLSCVWKHPQQFLIACTSTADSGRGR